MPSLQEWVAKGNIRRITRWSEPVMHIPTKPVTDFDDDLVQLAADMFATMYASDGVGLAGPQIDQSLAIFVFACPNINEQIEFGVVCNPTLTLPQGDERHLDSTPEGCLSWPGAYQPLSRPDFAICEGFNEKGEPIRIEGTGLLARCLQHETDHLNGTVFGDRLTKRARKALDKEHEQLAHLYPNDWPIHPMLEDRHA